MTRDTLCHQLLALPSYSPPHPQQVTQDQDGPSFFAVALEEVMQLLQCPNLIDGTVKPSAVSNQIYHGPGLVFMM